MAIHDLWSALTGGMLTWYEAKMFVEHASMFTNDALHVIVGALVWILVALLIRRPLSNWRPWLVLLLLLAANESVDLWIEQWPDLAAQYGESAKDLLLTMALPTLLMFVARTRPRLFTGAGARTAPRRPGGRSHRP